MTFLGYSLSLLYGILCLLISVVAYKLGMEKRYTRKIVHILVGFACGLLDLHGFARRILSKKAFRNDLLGFG